ncbi:MAG: polyprenyl synthetase family protein [Clostridia bacterium]|nr:polyprenyl synthetase family protein [Clostridia bacterium]
MIDIDEYLASAKSAFELDLNSYLDSYPAKFEPLWRAVKYAMAAGGKRLRPILSYLGAEFCGKSKDCVKYVAIAIEMIHTYSLIHDDMPCMDDDDLRHGRATVHKVFGEGIAMLAGDALLNMAFETLLSAEGECAKNAAKYISRASGMRGMVGGQCLDMNNRGDLDYDDLVAINRLKTSALLKGALCGSAIAAGCKDSEIADLEQFAEYLGEIFQIVDDILDMTSDEATLGKSVGQDEKNGKVTYASLNGIDSARQYIKELNKKAKSALAKYGDRAQALLALSDKLIDRAF